MEAMRNENGALHRVVLALAIGFALALTVYPPLAIGPDGRAAHGALMLLLLGIAAGFVSGVGFAPHHRLLRVVLGPWAALMLMAAGAGALARNAAW